MLAGEPCCEQWWRKTKGGPARDKRIMMAYNNAITNNTCNEIGNAAL